MRKTGKYRLLFLLIAISCYYLSFTFIPETTDTTLGLYPVIFASIIYFALLPVLHWFMIIKAGKQKAWKLILIFSLSSLVARHSYPEDVAQYFDFILWLRSPIIAILLVIELFLMYVIVKGLWQARNLKGDPHNGIINKFDDEKKQTLALTFATEPASWYYAIPRLSRNHIKALGKITLLSGKAWHIMLVIFSLFSLAFISSQLLVQRSETAAIIAATIILYGFIMLSANYRLSRHYSLYIQDKKLIINNTIFNFMVIPLKDIATITTTTEGLHPVNAIEKPLQKVTKAHSEASLVDEVQADEAQGEKIQNNKSVEIVSKEVLKIGRSKQHNIKITFKQPIKYWGMMGSFVESFEQLLINVEHPTQVISTISAINSPKQQ